MLGGCCHSAWLLTGHAQLPRPNASAIRTAGTGWTKPRAARNTNSAASAVSREAVRAAPCHHRKRSCSISTNEVEHGVSMSIENCTLSGRTLGRHHVEPPSPRCRR